MSIVQFGLGALCARWLSRLFAGADEHARCARVRVYRSYMLLIEGSVPCPSCLLLQDAMLREFQEEIARLRWQLEAGGDVGGEGPDADGGSAATGATTGQLQASAAALQHKPELDPEEVARIRRQLEGELRAEYSSAGLAVNAAALAQVCMAGSWRRLHDAFLERGKRLNSDRGCLDCLYC